MKRALAAVVVAATLLGGVAAQAKGESSVDPGILPGSRWYFLDKGLEDLRQWLTGISRKSTIAYLEKRMREREAEALAIAMRQGTIYETGPLADEALAALGERLRHKRDALTAAEGIVDQVERIAAIEGLREGAWRFDKDYRERIEAIRAKAEDRKQELRDEIAEARKSGDAAKLDELKERYVAAAAEAAAIAAREFQLHASDDRQAEMFENHLSGAEKARLVFQRVEQEEQERKNASWEKLFAALDGGKKALAEGKTDVLDQAVTQLQIGLREAKEEDRKLAAIEEAKKDPTVEPKAPEPPKRPAPAVPKPAQIGVPAKPAPAKPKLETIPSETVQTKPLVLVYYPVLAETVGTYVSVQYGAQDGLPPYHFQLETGGGFPPIGLILDANGRLSGTPKAAGNFKFSVCVVDMTGESVCYQTVFTVSEAQQAPPPPAPAPEPEVGTSIAVTGTSCTGDGTHVDVSGSASGPVGASIGIHYGDNVSCGSWTIRSFGGCTRSAGDPENTQWTFRFYKGQVSGDAQEIEVYSNTSGTKSARYEKPNCP
jgi:hypothetical protein